MTTISRLVLCLAFLPIPASAITPVGACKQGARQTLRATLRDCRFNRGTTTSSTTTTSTTTSTTTTTFEPLCGLSQVLMFETPCGRAVLCAEGGPGVIDPGRMLCANGHADVFNVYFPWAPPPAAGPVSGDCSGMFSTTGGASAFSCPVCCPAGVQMPATRAFCPQHYGYLCPVGPDFDACCSGAPSS